MSQKPLSVTDYQPLVKSIAAKYSRKGGDMDDLVQEGMVGLLEALKRYDADKGAEFSTYSSFWIEKKMRENLGQTWKEPRTVPEDLEQAEAVSPDRARGGRDFNPAWLEILSPLESQVIAKDYIESKTLAEIGRELGISRSRAKQIKQKALRKIRISSKADTLKKDANV